MGACFTSHAMEDQSPSWEEETRSAAIKAQEMTEMNTETHNHTKQIFDKLFASPLPYGVNAAAAPAG